MACHGRNRDFAWRMARSDTRARVLRSGRMSGGIVRKKNCQGRQSSAAGPLPFDP